jgi:hypothetical protein
LHGIRLAVHRAVSDARDLDLPDLLAGIIDDTRKLVEVQISSLRDDVGQRVSDLGTAIRSWLIAFTVAIVTLLLLGLALASTLHEIGLGWFASLWSVTAIAIGAVVFLVYRARVNSRKAAHPEPTIDSTEPVLELTTSQGT